MKLRQFFTYIFHYILLILYFVLRKKLSFCFLNKSISTKIKKINKLFFIVSIHATILICSIFQTVRYNLKIIENSDII